VKTIYALIDPRTSDVRYIGATTDVQRRLREHLRREEARHCSRWIRSLLASGLSPHVWVFEVVGDGWQAAERRWIQTFRDLEMATCNIADGGEGTSPGSTKSAETRAKMSAAATRWQTGRKLSAEQREKMSVAQLKRYEDPDQRALEQEVREAQVAQGEDADQPEEAQEGAEEVQESVEAEQERQAEEPDTDAGEPEGSSGTSRRRGSRKSS
jgi:Ni/Co efflux regulator RcnB